MPFYTDQLGRTVETKQRPQRIVSLVPSQTELLFDLGLEEEVVGITKFCIHPEQWFRGKTRVGGTKQLHIQKIKELKPDLIIANKEENLRQEIEELEKDFPLWISNINNLEDAIQMIESVGAIVNKPAKAKEITTGIKESFAVLKMPNAKPKTGYLIWQKPYMTVGADSFINDMMNYAGLDNIFSAKKRYPEITIEELQKANCELLLLSSEPYPFNQKQVDELQPHLPHCKILLVDGELFSWYGSRLLKAPSYFQELQNQVLSLTHAAGNG